MKKTIWLSASLVVLMGLAGCGGKDNNNNAPAANPYGQNQYPYGTPNPMVSGMPMVPGVGTQSCIQGQMCLRGQPYQTADLGQACQWANGQLVSTQGGTMCRTERSLGGGINTRLMMVGNFRKDFQISPSLMQGEVLKIYGSVNPRNSDNGWQIQVSQNGTVVGGAQSGAVVSDSDQNVLIYVVNQPINQQYQQNYAQPGYNQAGYGNTMMGVSTSYLISLYGRGTNGVKLRGSAILCENGFGNTYPCQ